MQDKVEESGYDIILITDNGLWSITYVCLPYAYTQLIQRGECSSYYISYVLMA